MRKNLVLVLLSCLLLSSCSLQTNNWSSFYYPTNDPQSTQKIINLDMFISLEDCLQSLRNIQIARSYRYDAYLDSYECGRKCKNDGYGLYICKETIDSLI